MKPCKRCGAPIEGKILHASFAGAQVRNEHIEWFERFAAAYLRWSHFNMDRIVSEAVKRHTVLLQERK